jgi:hypothetical protein
VITSRVKMNIGFLLVGVVNGSVCEARYTVGIAPGVDMKTRTPCLAWGYGCGKRGNE